MTDSVTSYQTREQQRNAQRRELTIRISEGKTHLLGCPGWESDKVVVLAAVRRQGGDLEYASATLKDDDEVVLTAVQQNGASIRSASERLQQNRTIALAAVKRMGKVITLLRPEFQLDDEIAVTAVVSDYGAISRIDERFAKNPEFAGACMMAGANIDKLVRSSCDFATSLQTYMMTHANLKPHGEWCADISHEGRVASTEPAKQLGGV